MKIDDNFSPYIAAYMKPDKENALTLLGKSAIDYTNMREDDEIRDIKIEDIKKKVRDDKKFAKLQSYDGGMGSFMREHGAFETTEGASAAENLFKSRATQRIAEGRYGLAARKANAPRRRKETPVSTENSSLDALNASLHGSSTKKTIIRRGKEKSTGKTIIQYSDGSVVYGK